MSKEEFRNEKLYQTTMHLARKMLDEGIISLRKSIVRSIQFSLRNISLFSAHYFRIYR